MHQRILVELDALIDTRLGTMACIDPQAAGDLLDNGYDTRMSDDFSRFTNRVSNETFREAYKNREVHSVILGVPTEMNASLLEILLLLEREKLGGAPDVESISVEVNYWPYKLEPWEVEHIGACIHSQIGTMAVLTMVSLPHSEMTLEYFLYKSYTAVVMYNFEDWADVILRPCNILTPPKTLLPAMSMIIPQITYLDEETLREGYNTRNSKGQHANPFEMTRFGLAAVIGITYYSSRHFSAMRMERPEERGHTQTQP